jgi:hypothetical protein
MGKFMQLKWQLRYALSLAALSLFGGCASQGLLIGEKPGDPAPQIVFLGARDAQGKDYLTWENVPSFGKVPAEFQAVGDLSCMRVSQNLRATGYHPRALDRYSKPIPGGGYFCQVALLSGNDSPPRLIVVNGSPGWDRPGAFSPVPEALASRAQEECANKGRLMRAIGYHASALDANGTVLPKGGFLCVE